MFHWESWNQQDKAHMAMRWEGVLCIVSGLCSAGWVSQLLLLSSAIHFQSKLLANKFDFGDLITYLPALIWTLKTNTVNRKHVITLLSFLHMATWWVAYFLPLSCCSVLVWHLPCSLPLNTNYLPQAGEAVLGNSFSPIATREVEALSGHIQQKTGKFTTISLNILIEYLILWFHLKTSDLRVQYHFNMQQICARYCSWCLGYISQKNYWRLAPWLNRIIFHVVPASQMSAGSCPSCSW